MEASMQDPCPWSWVRKQHNTIHNPLQHNSQPIQSITIHYNPLQPITNTIQCAVQL